MTIGPDRTADETANLLRRVARKRAHAGLVLYFETFWPAVWPALGVAGFFLCLALLDILPNLPPAAHIAVLALGAVAFVALLARGLAKLRYPDADAADRRLERSSGLRHRPLSVLADRPALPGAETIWRAHVARAAAQLSRLRVGLPHPSLAARDRMALRCGLVVALAACLCIAGGDAPLRVARALTPAFAPGPPAPASLVQAWITPPGYTGLPPVFLKPETPGASVPAGSHLTVSVTGGEGEPSLTLANHAQSFEKLDATSFQSDQDLASGGRLDVRRHGASLGAWDLTVIADAPPVALFPEPPGRARGGARIPQTRLPWEVHHEYGVVSLQAELRLRDRPSAPPIVVAIPLPNGNPKSAKGARLQDLTANPWAGLPVTAVLIAKDAPGATGRSEAAEFTLPERRFENPIARALIAVRRDLSRAPDEKAPAVLALDALAEAPDAWGHDWGAYLNLRAIADQIRHATGDHDIESAQARLWLLALHIEEGLTERTAKALAEARQQAKELLDKQKAGEKIDPAELEKKLAQVQDALQKHLQALAEQARRDPTSDQFDPDSHPLDARDMQKLAEEAKEAAKEGKMDEAQEKMAELDKLLEELQNARPEHGRMTEQERKRAQQRQRGQQQMSALQDIVRREGALLDSSQARDAAARDPRGQFQDPLRPIAPYPRPQFKTPQTPDESGDANPPASSPPAPSPEQQKQAKDRAHEQAIQQALRLAVGELMQQYGDLTGDVPPNLGDADNAMRDAREALAQNRDAPAASAETKAIEALQKGGRSMSMQMARQFGRSQDQQGDEGEGDDQDGDGDQAGSGDGQDQGGMYGLGNGPGRRPWDRRDHADRRADDRRDPLGRPLKEGTSGSDESGDVDVPEQMEQARSRAIQDELRKRDADRGRPQPELDYIERLLKQF